MSMISNAPAAARGLAGPARTTSLRMKFKHWLAAYRAWQAEQTAILQLGQMSEHDLHDIGLSRSDIPYTVTRESARERALRRGQ